MIRIEFFKLSGNIPGSLVITAKYRLCTKPNSSIFELTNLKFAIASPE